MPNWREADKMRELGPALFCGLAASLGRGSFHKIPWGCFQQSSGYPHLREKRGEPRQKVPWATGTVLELCWPGFTPAVWDTPPKRLKPGLVH